MSLKSIKRKRTTQRSLLFITTTKKKKVFILIGSFYETAEFFLQGMFVNKENTTPALYGEVVTTTLQRILQ